MTRLGKREEGEKRGGKGEKRERREEGKERRGKGEKRGERGGGGERRGKREEGEREEGKERRGGIEEGGERRGKREEGEERGGEGEGGRRDQHATMFQRQADKGTSLLLPEPVVAHTSTSLPRSAAGMLCICTGVGVWYFASFRLEHTVGASRQ